MLKLKSAYLVVCVCLALLFVGGVQAQVEAGLIDLDLAASPDRLGVGDETTVRLNISQTRGAACPSSSPQPLDVVLLMDVSGSMDDDNKLSLAKDAALSFIGAMDPAVDRVALVSFSDSASTIYGLTHDQNLARSGVGNLESIGGTEIAAGLRESTEVVAPTSRRPDATPAIVLLSDGQSDPSSARSAAHEAKGQNIVVYTISLGSDADRSLMRDLASSPSTYYHAPSASELIGIYREIQMRMAAQGVSGVILQAGVNEDAFDLVSVSSGGVVSDSEVIWDVGPLAVGQSQSVELSLEATQEGAHVGLASIEIVYSTCEEAPVGYAFGQGPSITVSGAISQSCQLCRGDPLSRGCISSLSRLEWGTWRCALAGLPWWLRLLIPLLVLYMLFLLFWWRRKGHQRQATRRLSPVLVPPTIDRMRSLPSPQVTLPSRLPLVNPPSEASLAPTLIVGLGEAGRETVEILERTLMETCGERPSTFRTIVLQFAESTADQDTDIVYLPLPPEELRSMLREAEAMEESPSWYSSRVGQALEEAASQSDPPASSTRFTQRLLGRLSVIRNHSRLEACLRRELHALGEGQATIYLVGSLAEGYASGAIIDVAHLLRVQAVESSTLSCLLEGLLLLPAAHEKHAVAFDEEAQGRSIAFAAWRELDRFQSVFEYPYPFHLGNRSTIQQGRLFDRCYLLSRERSDGLGLFGEDASTTLYPAIADLILTLSDDRFSPQWASVAQAVAERTGRQQHQREQVLYGSLGSFTYILPVDDLVQDTALQLAREMVEHLSRRELSGAREISVDLLSRPHAATDVTPTKLMRDVRDCMGPSMSEVREHVRATGVEALSLLSPLAESEGQGETLASWHALVSNGVTEGVQTSAEAGAAEYAHDTTRFLRDVDSVLERTACLASYLNACREGQVQVFGHLLTERLLELLNGDKDGRGCGSLGAALSVASELIEVIAHSNDAVAAVHRDAVRELGSLEDELKEDRESLVDVASHTTIGPPTVGKVLIRGAVPAAVAVVVLGLLSLALPNLLLPIGALALLVAGIGSWLSWQALEGLPEIIKRQSHYREHAQQVLKLRVEVELYRAWEATLGVWLKTLQAHVDSLEDWLRVWQSPDLASALQARQAETEARRQVRRGIRVRHYLDDERIREDLCRRYVRPIMDRDAPHNRFVWSRPTEDGPACWSLSVVGAEVDHLGIPDIGSALPAVLALGSAYANPLRGLCVADVLADQLTPEAMAQEGGIRSAPLISITPNEQPLSEVHRFVVVNGNRQTEFFAQLVSELRRPSANAHSQQLGSAAHPYRCALIASLDLLQNAGLPEWHRVRANYTHLPSRLRQLLHLFPAERNAIMTEGALTRIGLASRILSPEATLTLEDAERARFFWLAYAYGWIREIPVERRGMSSLRQLALVLPDSQPLGITQPHEDTPQLWRAAVAYVLEGVGKHAHVTVRALTQWDESVESGELREKRRVLRHALRAAYELQQVRRPLDRELGCLLHVFADDALRRLEGQPGVWEE